MWDWKRRSVHYFTHTMVMCIVFFLKACAYDVRVPLIHLLVFFFVVAHPLSYLIMFSVCIYKFMPKNKWECAKKKSNAQLAIKECCLLSQKQIHVKTLSGIQRLTWLLLLEIFEIFSWLLVLLSVKSPEPEYLFCFFFSISQLYTEKKKRNLSLENSANIFWHQDIAQWSIFFLFRFF